jgi:hypothetical protein
MVNSRKFTLGAVVALLLTTGCAPISDYFGGGFAEEPAGVDNYNVHIFGRRTGLEPCSLAQVARHTC